MGYNEMDNSKSVADWLNSCKQSVKGQYVNRWLIWLEYCKIHGLPTTGDLQLEDMKKRRESNDNGIKYFYDDTVPNFCKKVYIGKTQKHFSEGSSLSTTTAVRSFFSYHRYPLQIKDGSLPSSDKIKNITTDHAFTIYELRTMFNLGDLAERTILCTGLNLWLRVGDFSKLDRETIQLAISRENELAAQEKRPPNTIEFEINTEKESEPCSCHLSREAIELLEQYLKTYPQKNGYLFPYQVDRLNDIVKNLAIKAKITLGKLERVRWHCLRKFGITVMHSRIQESVMKYMTGKHIEKSLKTYIQANNETFKAFKLIEPFISLTKSNGNGKASKELEELKKENADLKRMFKLLAEAQTEEVTKNLFNKLKAEGYHEAFVFGEGSAQKAHTTVKINGEKVQIEPIEGKYTAEKILMKLNEIQELKEKKDLERVLAENGNNHE